MRNSTKNAIAAVVAIVLAVVIVIACGIGSSWFTNSDIATWFNSWGKGEHTEQPDEVTPEEGGEDGAVLEESESNGVALMSAKIATADYEAYGVSPLADTAYTLTATLDPADILDNGITLSAEWTNSSDSWALGKEVSDYVTLSEYEIVSGDSITIECLQNFGEQITITAVADADDSITATCTVDYLQKVTSVTLSFGDVTSGAKTSPSSWSFPTVWETGMDATGKGGEASLDYTTDSVYTIGDTFNVDISCSLTFKPVTTEYGTYIADMPLVESGSTTALAEAIENGAEVYFDNTFFDTYATPMGSEYPWGASWNRGIGDQYFDYLLSLEDWEISQYFCLNVVVNIVGAESDYSYTFMIYPESSTYNPVLNSINLSGNSFVF